MLSPVFVFQIMEVSFVPGGFVPLQVRPTAKSYLEGFDPC